MYFVDNLNLVKRGETIRVGSITCMICFLYKRYKKKITTRDVHCWRYLYKITLYLLLTKRFVKLHPCHRNVFLINHNCSNCSFPCIADNAPVKDDCLAKMSIRYINDTMFCFHTNMIRANLRYNAKMKSTRMYILKDLS